MKEQKVKDTRQQSQLKKLLVYVLAMIACVAVETLILTHRTHLLCTGEKMKTTYINTLKASFVYLSYGK